MFEKGLELYPHTVAILNSVGKDLTSKVTLEIDFNLLLASGALKKHSAADVAVAKIGDYADGKITYAEGVKRTSTLPAGIGLIGLNIENTHRFDEVTIGSETVLFGYPGSLGRPKQIDGSRPLLRRGMVAGKSEDRRLILDCPVYFANSGALVIESVQTTTSEWAFPAIGLITEMVPFVEELWSRQFNAQTGIRYENSGYSIVEPIDRVIELF